MPKSDAWHEAQEARTQLADTRETIHDLRNQVSEYRLWAQLVEQDLQHLLRAPYSLYPASRTKIEKLLALMPGKEES